MGLKSPQMDVVTPTRGREMSKTCTREKEGIFTGDILADLDSGWIFLFLLDVGLRRPMTSPL
jgi:hypothetical protein